MKTVVVVLWGIAAVGCNLGHGGSLRARSAGDMNCPKSELSIYQLDDRSYRVEGCGQEAVYIESCERPNSMESECTWVLNSTRDDGQQHTGSMADPAPRKATPTASAAPGCSYDTQCKGDRVCVKHECVAAPEADANP